MSELWQHQKDFIELASKKRHVAALMKPGSGKTRAMIEVLRRDYSMRKSIINTLIFAPLVPCTGWQVAFSQYSKISSDDVLVLTMAGKKRAEILNKRIESKRPCIVVTNYEAVQVPSFYESLLRFSPEYLIADESQRVKDAGSVRAKKIYPLCTAASRRFILTGTFTPNSMLDIFGQLKFLDATILGPSFWQFRQRYFYDKNAGMPSHLHWPEFLPRPEAAEMIGRIIAENSVQAGEAKDLPPLLEITLPVDLGVDQQKAYNSMLKDFVAEFKSTVAFAEFSMVKSLKLRQIVSGFVQLDASSEAAYFDDNPRLAALSDLLDSLGKERVLIWTDFRPTYPMLEKICKKLGRKVGFITGDQSIKEKNATVSDFVSARVDTIIANPAAASEGIDSLQIARYAIWYTRSYNSLHYLQSKARNFRGGSEQHENVVHYVLESPGTIDAVIGSALSSKKSVSDSVIEWARVLSK